MTVHFLWGILVSAVVTYLIRMLPMVLFRKEITNRFILSFLKYVPYAVLAAMTVPDIFYATSSFVSGIVGFVVAVALALWKPNLLLVACGSCAGVLITELIMMWTNTLVL